MLSGPNGSGKSTFFKHYFGGWWKHAFINADLIARDELGAGADGATLQAIRIAQARKLDHLDHGVSFATEGLQVDTELLSLAKERGYRTHVISVALAAPILNVLRVRQRVLTGGHNVPEGAIIRRYERALRSMLEGPPLADRVLLVDNSGLRYHFVARWRSGRARPARLGRSTLRHRIRSAPCSTIASGLQIIRKWLPQASRTTPRFSQRTAKRSRST